MPEPATTAAPVELLEVDVPPDRRARFPVPTGWVLELGPPLTAMPADWHGVAPGLVVTCAPGDGPATDRRAPATEPGGEILCAVGCRTILWRTR